MSTLTLLLLLRRRLAHAPAPGREPEMEAEGWLVRRWIERTQIVGLRKTKRLPSLTHVVDGAGKCKTSALATA
ncbi:hypothetical protein F4824DRAFT_501758 [Ustulina deusta]|nr:hypothetical protein F4824DRAFT_501758 [Ustulina deusta]